MNLATLTSLKPSEFEDAADGYRSTSDMASQTKDSLENQITAALQRDLEGVAATAAVDELRELTKNFHYIQVECGLINTVLNALASDLRPAKKKLETALADAEARKFTVGADGSVAYPAAGDKADGELPQGGTAKGYTDDAARGIADQAGNFDPNPNYKYAQDCADRIAEALKEATEADQKWAPALRKLKADDDLTVSDEDWVDAKKDMAAVRTGAEDYLGDIKAPSKDGSPEDNATWWKGLSEEHRDAYVSLHPASVGKLDGLPSGIRDEANRTVLAEARAEYQLRSETIPPEPRNKLVPHGPDGYAYSNEWLEWNKKYADERRHVDSSLRGMDAIQARFDAGNDLPEAYLLGFSPDGTGRAIVANGNPDMADHTAVYVPGTTSNLGSTGGDVDRMTEVWKVSSAMADGKNVSTITWLGYDAPQSLVTDSPSSRYANEAAPDLNRFMNGLSVTNGTDSGGHHTVIGHSYGTTVIGSAARQGDLDADDVVLVGSPGVQVASAAELGVPGDHVWNQDAKGDPVPEVGRAKHGGIKEVDPDTLEPWGRDGYRYGYGDADRIIPSDDEFGANQMTTDTTGHTDYWEGKVGLKNQAAVVVGEYDRVNLK